MSYSSRVYRQRNAHTHDEASKETDASKQHDIDQDKKNNASRPTLKVNEPGDSYEKEADAVASKVVSNAGKSATVQQKKMDTVQRLSTSAEEDKFSTNDARMKKDKDVQRAAAEPDKEKDKVQKMEAPKKEEEKPVQKKDETKKEEDKVQKMEAPKKEEEKPVQKKDETKKEEDKVQKMESPKKEEEKPVQKKDETKKEEDKVQKMESPKKEEDKTTGTVQRKPADGHTETSAHVTEKIKQRAGKGEPLPVKILHEMNNAFGVDFSGVRIHKDEEAISLTKKLNAHAFTHGYDIYFNEGKYDPSQSAGKELLAHELTHVVQQQRGSLPQSEKNKHPVSPANPEKKER